MNNSNMPRATKFLTIPDAIAIRHLLGAICDIMANTEGRVPDPIGEPGRSISALADWLDENEKPVPGTTA